MLSKMINEYVKLRRAMGFKYRVQNYLLQSFSAFAKQRGDIYVHSKTVLEWAKLAPSHPQKRRRLLTVRRFAITAHAEDERHEVPLLDALGREKFNRHERRIPHIISTEELRSLLCATLQLKPKNTIRPMTYATLFALLAATGLRISEAIALNTKDVTDDGLVICATKFHKNRLVPLHETTRKGIQNYLEYRIRYKAIIPSLFISNKGTILHYEEVNRIFLQLVRSIGLRDKPGQPGIHIHDLRHRFAVRSLEQCVTKDRSEISRHMIALSTYLGHAHISDTYWYLQATPVLMAQIAKTQELFYIRERK